MGENGDFQPLYAKNISQTVSNMATVTIIPPTGSRLSATEYRLVTYRSASISSLEIMTDTRTAVALLPLRQLGFLGFFSVGHVNLLNLTNK